MNPPRATPLLVYDGDCSFCKFWVEYWKSLTGGRVVYAPYQEVAEEFPEISIASFQAAAQLIEPDGTISSGADAVFRSLDCVPKMRWMRWCYEHVPGGRSVADASYGFMARHRSSLFRLTRLLWGDKLERSRFDLTRSITLRLLAAVYLIAFASWLPQVRGLIGSNGLLPARELLTLLHIDLGVRAYLSVPTLAWLNPSDGFLKFLTGAGVALAVPAILGIAMGPCLALMWLLYLSQVTIGRDFMAFQWDVLLLEAGFLAMFFAPWTLRISRAAPPSRAWVWLFRWLAFRVVFLSGVVKLESGDPAWRGLTAMSYHYLTQPLPNVFSWYVSHAPLWFQKASTVFVFAEELLIPMFIFAPRRLRHAAAYLLILLQLLILLTGNYCFFNLLTIVLCLTLFDDATFRQWVPQAIRERVEIRGDEMPRVLWQRVVVGVVAVLIVAISLHQIAERFDLPEPETASRMARSLGPYYISNAYGLFAVMTTTRQEIIVEGSDDGQNWLAYEFPYKPGDLSQHPKWAQPHQPRLDWQMWFAALGNYRNNRWFVTLAVRLLEGSPDVLRLIEKNPFPQHPPQYIRARVFDYRFTTAAERKATGNWWARQLLGEYLPPVSLNKSR